MPRILTPEQREARRLRNNERHRIYYQANKVSCNARRRRNEASARWQNVLAGKTIEGTPRRRAPRRSIVERMTMTHDELHALEKRRRTKPEAPSSAPTIQDILARYTR